MGDAHHSDDVAFGRSVKGLRIEREWKSWELARKAGISRTYVLLIEAGSGVRAYDDIAKIASAFEMTEVELVRELRLQVHYPYRAGEAIALTQAVRIAADTTLDSDFDLSVSEESLSGAMAQATSVIDADAFRKFESDLLNLGHMRWRLEQSHKQIADLTDRVTALEMVAEHTSDAPQCSSSRRWWQIWNREKHA